MGFRFRKSVKILPGVRLNFSKSGVSTTIGVRGASVNFGKRGTYLNTRIPGTGISRRERIGSPSGGPPPLPAQGGSSGAGVGMAVGLMLLIAGFATCAPDAEYRSYTPPPLSTAAAVEATEGFYAHSALNVRSEPNRNGSIIRTLARGDYMQLGAKDGKGWAGLYSGGAREGYVYRASDAVRRSAPASRTYSTPQPLASPRRSRRSSAESRGYYTGPRGGCYTYSASGRKRYVDRSLCS